MPGSKRKDANGCLFSKCSLVSFAFSRGRKAVEVCIGSRKVMKMVVCHCESRSVGKKERGGFFNKRKGCKSV